MSTDYQRSIDKVISEIHALDERTIQDALKSLKELHSEIIIEIKAGVGTELTLNRLQQTQHAIEIHIRAFENEAARLISNSLNSSFDLGQKLIDEPLKTLSLAAPPVSREIVQTLTGFTATRIKGITADVKDRISGILHRAVLTKMNANEAIREIGSVLESTGAFKEVAYRAERIYRTEVLRIFSMASDLKMQASARVMEGTDYEMQKGWLSAHDPRVRAAHLAADLVYMSDPIPVDKPFLVDGEELMYPRDANGSAENTINCRCVSTPHIKRVAARTALAA